MKRGGPLRRRRRLVARTALQPGSKGLAPGAGLAPGRPPAHTRPAVDAVAAAADSEASGAWHHYVLLRARGVCEGCGRAATTEDPLEAHHVTKQEHIKQYVRGLGLQPHEARRVLRRLRWDTRNGMGLHRSCHNRHTLQAHKVPRWALRAEHREFARELGLERHLDSLYG